MSICISGVLVRARPECFDAALAAVEAVEGAEVHWKSNSDGKIVVVLETPGTDAACSRIAQISEISGVVGADLSYSYSPDQGATGNG